MLYKWERSIRLPLFLLRLDLGLRLGGLGDADLPRPLHRHLDALLGEKTRVYQTDKF